MSNSVETAQSKRKTRYLKSKEARAINAAMSSVVDTRMSALRAINAAEQLPQRERMKMLPVTYDLINSVGRVAQRRTSDLRTDSIRRVLVGARVPVEVHARYKAIAAERGISLYAWVCAALEAAAHAHELAKAEQDRSTPEFKKSLRDPSGVTKPKESLAKRLYNWVFFYKDS